MKKLLMYDIKNQNRKLMMVLILTVITILMIALIKDEFIRGVLVLIWIVTLLIGFFLTFDSMFRTRFTKDDLLHYTSLSKRTIVLEPIVLTLLYMVCMMSVLALLNACFLRHDFLEYLFELEGNGRETNLLFLFACSSVTLFWSCMLLFLWSVMKRLDIRSTSRYEVAYIIALTCGIAFTKGAAALQIDRPIQILLMFSLSLLLMLLMYVNFMRES